MKRFHWLLTWLCALIVAALAPVGCMTQHGYPSPRSGRSASASSKARTQEQWSYPKNKNRNNATAAASRKSEAAASKNAQKLVKEVRKWIGTPYRYAGNTRSGVDCSGLTMEVYLKVEGIKLPRSAASQQQFCQSISKSQLQPGDLVFFSTTGRAVTHVGMYVGDGRMVHASPTYGVVEVSLDDAYFVRNYHSSGRVLGHAMPSSEPVATPQPTVAVPPVPAAVRQPVQAIEVRVESLNSVLDSLINNVIAEPDFFD